MKGTIQSADAKSLNWKAAFSSHGMELICCPGSPIKVPFRIIKLWLSGQKTSFHIVRYLNDYPSFWKTLLRVFSEVLLVILSKIFSIKLFWICHNVDRESGQSYPGFSQFRRKLFYANTERIFVMDQHLVPFAQKVLKDSKTKIEGISFGEVKKKSIENPELRDCIIWCQQKRQEAELAGQKFFATLLSGAPSTDKSLHFDYLESLIAKAREKGIFIVAVVAGDFPEGERCANLLERYTKNPQIYCFTKFTDFDETFISRNIDFYFRGYADYSVPFTIYEASYLNKPTLALESCFLPDMVRAYKIGSVVSEDMSNVAEAFRELESVKPSAFEEFKAGHNWDLLAGKIRKYT